ncbi:MULTISPECIES: sensor histidine kinase [unclassified Kribbella]|uniref:sensor histidine kinase n=1 Tax=unclassified Kribbella TaxID=2644121 RepID=UPI0030176CF5
MDQTAVRRWVGCHPLHLDVVLACAVVAAGVVGELSGMRGQTDGVINTRDVAALAIALVAILTRRVRPRRTLVATAVAAAVLLVVTEVEQPALFAAMVIVTFTMASSTDRRSAVLLAGPIAVGLYFVDAFVSTGSAWSPQSAALVAWMGMATAAGDAVRSRRAYVAAVEERARRAEQTREEEAARRVVQERVRIARELHDVVAHHIAVINVQAGAASHILHRQPEQADRALTHIRAACGTVLAELASIVGILREADDPDPTTEPVRGLARLTDMLDALAAAGLTVERKQLGEARELPAVVDLAAYRILQEALTNAHKYGTGTACLTITYTTDAVTLDVVNSIAAHIPTGSGYGILGMKERAATAGGTLDAHARPDGPFTVHAELPAPALKAAE